MDVEKFREFCLSLPQAKENAPWKERQYQNLVTFTIGGKWFALLDLENKFCDVKADSQTIEEMQEKYNAAFPAWHMDKTHWLGVRLESDMPDAQIECLLKEGYELVVKSLSKAIREELKLI